MYVQIGCLVVAPLCPKVLPDWSGDATTSATTPVEQAAQHWADRLRRFNDRHMSKAARKKADAAAKDERIPNQAYIQAMDHGLKAGMGSSLAAFIPSQPLKPLAATEVRFFSEEVGLLPPDPGGCTLPRTRSCILDRSTGKSRYELNLAIKDGRVWRPTLITHTDQGTIGWLSLFWLYLKFHARGFMSPDPWHRIWNNAKGDLKAAGLSLTVLETTACFNLPGGPWKGCAFYFRVVEAAGEYFAKATWQDELYQQLYPRICVDKGWDQASHHRQHSVNTCFVVGCGRPVSVSCWGAPRAVVCSSCWHLLGVAFFPAPWASPHSYPRLWHMAPRSTCSRCGSSCPRARASREEASR